MRSEALVTLCMMALTLSLPVRAQQSPITEPAASPSSPGTQAPETNIYGGYMIGRGDILDVRVTDEDAITGRYQVDPDGKIRLPLLADPVSAAGLTTFELSSKLRTELRMQEILRAPSVTVFIVRGMSQNVTILGAVLRPGMYTLEQPTTLLNLISRAGGLQPNAGRVLNVKHRSGANSDSDGVQDVANNEAGQSVDLPALMSGKNRQNNLFVRAGDVITVTTAPVVFVVGAVTRPGVFTVQSSRAEMTVLQAVAMAEGVLPTAAQDRTVIVRQSSDEKERQEILVDLNAVIRGKEPDRVLLADDILFVPESGSKVMMRHIADVAVQAASRMAAYGALAGF